MHVSSPGKYSHSIEELKCQQRLASAAKVPLSHWMADQKILQFASAPPCTPCTNGQVLAYTNVCVRVSTPLGCRLPALVRSFAAIKHKYRNRRHSSDRCCQTALNQQTKRRITTATIVTLQNNNNSSDMQTTYTCHFSVAVLLLFLLLHVGCTHVWVAVAGCCFCYCRQLYGACCRQHTYAWFLPYFVVVFLIFVSCISFSHFFLNFVRAFDLKKSLQSNKCISQWDMWSLEGELISKAL